MEFPFLPVLASKTIDSTAANFDRLTNVACTSEEVICRYSRGQVDSILIWEFASSAHLNFCTRIATINWAMRIDAEAQRRFVKHNHPLASIIIKPLHFRSHLFPPKYERVVNRIRKQILFVRVTRATNNCRSASQGTRTLAHAARGKCWRNLNQQISKLGRHKAQTHPLPHYQYQCWNLLKKSWT